VTIPFDAAHHPSVPVSATGLPTGGRRPRLAADLVTLTKPRITVMNVMPMLGGAWLAANHAPEPPPARQVMLATLGTALVIASANALNMWVERSTDGLMARTRNRPLPTGRMPASLALGFGLALGVAALLVLALGVNAVTTALAAVALVSYVALYTPLKRKTRHSLLVGAVPGAIPPLLGWTAVTGQIQAPGLVLFGILFLWQIPHFLAIATFRRDEYARAGMKVMTVERGQRATRLNIVGYLVALLAVTLGLVATGVGGKLYVGAAAVLGALFLASGAWGLRPSAGDRWARGLFAVSIGYLVLLFSALMVSP
jgi:protoheme IX farnesyltransferase